MTLNSLSVGATGVVCGYAAGLKGVRDKLLAMGLTKGVQVTLEQVAPLGDPLKIRVRDFSLSIRRSEAEFIIVKEAKNE